MISIKSVLKTKIFQKTREAKSVALKKGICLLDHIEKIVEISTEYGLDKSLTKGKIHFDYVTKALGISPLQGALFSQFMEKSDNNHIEINEIAESLQCSKIRMIKYINECEELEKKKLIRCSRDDESTTYRVPHNVCESIRKFGEYRPEKRDNLDIWNLFSVLERLFDERKENESTFENLKLELLDLIGMNMHLEFCRKIMSYNLCDTDLVLLICFCHLAGNNYDDNIGVHDFIFLYDDTMMVSELKREFQMGDHILICGKYITPVNSDGFVNSESWKLSDMAKKELLSELNIKGNRNYEKNLILSGTIKPKDMFYDPKEAGEIKKLISLLSGANFRKIQDRLDEKGMRKGFCCLFSGGPGTGKTETAYQIARQTGRNIMMVDISETKSMWFGESEKKIKEIFDTYRRAVENSSITPILLFNEADAVLGKRMEFNSSSRSVDQTSNTIQNIILQEIETLSGILIATTNLTLNMDSAFERRFLYKIKFDKPGIESRSGIWSTLLPDLNKDRLLELSGKFELTGGEIENIARKIQVDAILNGSELSMDTLVQYCKDEIQNGFNASKKIGFGQN